MGFRIRSSWPLFIILALTTAGAVATVLPDSSQKTIPGHEGDRVWRRTKDGWEIAWWLQPTKTFHNPHLHPLVVAACQLIMVSLLGLFGRGNSQGHWPPFQKDEDSRAGHSTDQAHTSAQISQRSFNKAPHSFKTDKLTRISPKPEKSRGAASQ